MHTEMTMAVARARSGCVLAVTGPAVVEAGTGGAEHGGNRERKLKASLGREECEVAFWTPPPPPPGLYRTVCGSRTVSLPNFRYT